MPLEVCSHKTVPFLTDMSPAPVSPRDCAQAMFLDLSQDSLVALLLNEPLCVVDGACARGSASANHDHAFRYAADLGHLGLVQRLLPFVTTTCIADALSSAAANGHVAVVACLLPSVIHDDRCRALADAVRFGHREVIVLLATHGVRSRRLRTSA
jgi:hypothetical protein